MTKYGVYIIESLRGDDYFDGETLHEILELSHIPSIYKWADSIDELKSHLNDFNKSNYRYLHLSCHADETGIEINGDSITNSELQIFTKNILRNKRLFLSACKGANRDLASKIIVTNQAYSLIATPVNLRFDKSVLFWPSFYHTINEIDSRKMRRQHIIDVLKKCVDLFKVPINYYSKINGDKNFLWRLKIRENQRIDNRKIKRNLKQQLK